MYTTTKLEMNSVCDLLNRVVRRWLTSSGFFMEIQFYMCYYIVRLTSFFFFGLYVKSQCFSKLAYLTLFHISLFLVQTVAYKGKSMYCGLTASQG